MPLATPSGGPETPEPSEKTSPARRVIRKRRTLRDVALVVHRYVGLLMATFLIVAGTTGTIIAFYADLDAAFNPELFRARPPHAGAAMLDPIALAERVEAQSTSDEALHGVILGLSPGETVNYWIDEREVFADPYTGRVVGSRKWGDIREGWKNLFPFIYRLHFTLALGDVGMTIFGIVALLWTIDCFVGAYLTFPPRTRGGGGARGPSWLRRWLSSWSLNTSKLFSFIFSWHRASGLFVWMMLFVFAWSGVALCLSEPVYEPVMGALFGEEHDALANVPELPTPRTTPALDMRAALARGRELMAEEARRRGFRVLHEGWMDYDEARGLYHYSVESTLCIAERLSGTHVVFDGDTGRQLAFGAPTGQHTGATISGWLIALHFGAVREGGLLYRSFVCAMGLVVVLLTVSGVWIWWKKRAPRRRAL